jgi:hypothetical protein
MSGMFEASNFANDSASNAGGGVDDIGRWNTSNVTDMSRMFYNCPTFNCPITTSANYQWNTSNVTTTVNMFAGASAFNKRISHWNVGNVVTMSGMFASINLGGMLFNNGYSICQTGSEMGTWNTSKVVDMANMFGVILSTAQNSFDQPIGSWNVSKVRNFAGMFQYSGFGRASAGFSGSGAACPSNTMTDWNTGNWNITSASAGASFTNFFSAAKSSASYSPIGMSSLLSGWVANANPTLPSGINANFGAVAFVSASGAAALNTLRTTRGWTITIGNAI